MVKFDFHFCDYMLAHVLFLPLATVELLSSNSPTIITTPVWYFEKFKAY